MGEMHWPPFPLGYPPRPYFEPHCGEGPGRLSPGLGPDPGVHPLRLEKAPVRDCYRGNIKRNLLIFFCAIYLKGVPLYCKGNILLVRFAAHSTFFPFIILPTCQNSHYHCLIINSFQEIPRSYADLINKTLFRKRLLLWIYEKYFAYLLMLICIYICAGRG